MSISTGLVNAAKPHLNHMGVLLQNASYHGANIAHHAVKGLYLEPLKINFMVVAALCLTGKALANRANNLQLEGCLPVTHAPNGYNLSEKGVFLAKKVALYAGAAFCFSLAAYELYHTLSEYHFVGKSSNCKVLQEAVKESADEEIRLKNLLVKSELDHRAACNGEGKRICPAFLDSYTDQIETVQTTFAELKDQLRHYGCLALSAREDL
ncbi:MAG: hypothetical protein JSS30_06325 [Verrucomicrobia bacterium]|nr:hypothetical protein [Verrucomicrobiota bacterium]